jgi:hypothetical protein
VSDPNSDAAGGVRLDPLEQLAYLIAEEFVVEVESRLAEGLLTDPTLRHLADQPTPKARVAGGSS